MSNVFSKADTSATKVFMNVVQNKTKVEDQEILSSVIIEIRKKLEGTGVSVEAYIGNDNKPIIELRY